MARLRFGHQRPLNRRCPDEKYQDVNNNRLTEYPGSPAWTPATSKSRVSVRQLDTRDLLVAGVRISISPKYLYLYLELSGSTFHEIVVKIVWLVNCYFSCVSKRTEIITDMETNRCRNTLLVQSYVLTSNEMLTTFKKF